MLHLLNDNMFLSPDLFLLNLLVLRTRLVNMFCAFITLSVKGVPDQILLFEYCCDNKV